MLDPVVGSEQDGKRPVVIIQNNFGNKYSPTVIVAPLTKKIKKAYLPTHVIISEKQYLKYNSMILLEQTRTIDKSRLINYLGRLDESEINKIDVFLINTFDISIIEYLKFLELGGFRNVKKTEKLYSNYYYKEK